MFFINMYYTCVSMRPPSDCLCSTSGRGSWPQSQTPAGNQVWSRRGAVSRPGSYGVRLEPTEPPPNRRAPLKPQNGKPGGRIGATLGEAKWQGSGWGDNKDFFYSLNRYTHKFITRGILIRFCYHWCRSLVVYSVFTHYFLSLLKCNDPGLYYIMYNSLISLN